VSGRFDRRLTVVALLTALLFACLALPRTSPAATVRAELTWDSIADMDLLVYEDNQDAYADPSAPDHLANGHVSANISHGPGPETFTDYDSPNTRRLQFCAVYRGSGDTGSAELPTTHVTMVLTDPDGTKRTSTAAFDASEWIDFGMSPPGGAGIVSCQDAAPPFTIVTPAPAPGAGPPSADQCPALSVAAGTTTRSNDLDCDGVPNGGDTCPTRAGSPLGNGCPANDPDGDEVLGFDDHCPTVPEHGGTKGCPNDSLFCTKFPPLLITGVAAAVALAYTPETCMTDADFDELTRQNGDDARRAGIDLFKGCVFDPNDVKTIVGLVGEHLPERGSIDRNGRAHLPNGRFATNRYAKLLKTARVAQHTLGKVSKIGCAISAAEIAGRPEPSGRRKIKTYRASISSAPAAAGPIALPPNLKASLGAPPSCDGFAPCQGLIDAGNLWLREQAKVASMNLAFVDSADRAGTSSSNDFAAQVAVAKVYLGRFGLALKKEARASKKFAAALRKARITGRVSLDQGSAHVTALSGVRSQIGSLLQPRGLDVADLQATIRATLAAADLPKSASYPSLFESSLSPARYSAGYEGIGLGQLMALVGYLGRSGAVSTAGLAELQGPLNAAAAACSAPARGAALRSFIADTKRKEIVTGPTASVLGSAARPLLKQSPASEPFAPGC
jgi:hypothetical protein